MQWGNIIQNQFPDFQFHTVLSRLIGTRVVKPRTGDWGCQIRHNTQWPLTNWTINYHNNNLQLILKWIKLSLQSLASLLRNCSHFNLGSWLLDLRFYSSSEIPRNCSQSDLVEDKLALTHTGWSPTERDRKYFSVPSWFIFVTNSQYLPDTWRRHSTGAAVTPKPQSVRTQTWSGSHVWSREAQ